MARVLVTGGTGLLGRRVVPQLVARGHGVRVLSRHGGALGDDIESMCGDVRTGEGLAEAVRECDAVIHAATSPGRGVRETEVAGTRNVLDAIKGSGAHFLYVSIVGVDQIGFPYYKAKWEAENVVAASASPWTIQRATQFHDLLDNLLSYLVFISTPHLAFQVVDAGEVAGRLVDLVEAGPSGRASEFGGPEVVPIKELASIRREITGKRARLVPVPRLGFLREMDRGLNLSPANRVGRITWRDWLRANRS